MIFPFSKEIIFKTVEDLCEVNYDIPSGPSYILSDGRFVHIKTIKLPFKLKAMHPTLEILVRQKFGIPEDVLRDLFVKLGAIRVNDATISCNDIYIDLPDELTNEQYNSLIKYLDVNTNERNLHYLCIYHFSHCLYDSYKDGLLQTDDIIKQIKLYISQNNKKDC